MKERIKQVRIELGMSQSKFAESLLISRSAICKMESGENEPSAQTIGLICSKFSVNEEWLRTGNGEMHKKRTKSQELLNFTNDVLSDVDDSFKKRFMLALSKLNESDWETLRKIADELTKED